MHVREQGWREGRGGEAAPFLKVVEQGHRMRAPGPAQGWSDGQGAEAKATGVGGAVTGGPRGLGDGDGDSDAAAGRGGQGRFPDAGTPGTG